VDEPGSGANENLLTAAREALGLTQAQLAARLTELADGDQPVSQGYVSRAEKGALTVTGERLALFAEALQVTPGLLASDARVWSLGDGCLYHRHRRATRASALRQLHAQVNMVHVHLTRLARAVGWQLPGFTWVPVRTGGADSPADVARRVRESCGIGSGPVPSVTAVAEQMGALVVTLPLGGREVDATSLHPPGGPPLFVVNSDAPPERQRFTLGHELGHVTCDPGSGSDPEETAHRFSAELLAPSRELYMDLKASDITPARLLELKRKWLISAAALLYQAHDLAVIRESQYRRFSAQISALGWRTSEPGPLPAEHPAIVPQLVREAIKTTGSTQAAAAAAGTTTAMIRALAGQPDEVQQIGEASDD
jgi:Zn-dependent peptidase ImmA (M78 family)/transcriptional regulator with XRE-family HTH domain